MMEIEFDMAPAATVNASYKEQIRKLTLMSLVTSLYFRGCVLKFRQCKVSKDHISMNNGDNFIICRITS